MGLRILLVTPMPPQASAPGAIPLVLHAQLEGLRRHHTVTLATLAGQEPGEVQAVADLQASGLEVHAVLRPPPRGLKVWRRRSRLINAWLFESLPWRSAWFWEPAFQRLLNHLLASREFDLVIVEDNSMGTYEYPTRAPKLFTEHEVRRPRRVDWSGLLESLPSLRRTIGWAFRELDWRRWPAYQRQTWRKFDFLQTFSSRDLHAIGEIAPELVRPAALNPFGIVLPEAANPDAQQPDSLLFVGNYTHAPNVDAALWLGREIMPRLLSLVPQARLELVGIYPPMEVQNLAGESIHVAGHVSDLRPMLEQAAVVLAPVRLGGGMRMKVLQSMAAGKAVVTTRRGAEGLDTWAEQPPLIIAEEAEDFARAIAGLLYDPQARRELGERARLYVSEHFSPQAYTRRIEAAYASLNGTDRGVDAARQPEEAAGEREGAE
jgi:polysaccharide biosynthesis protein PslH